MSDMALTDMTAFFERHEGRARRAIAILACASLAVTAGAFAYAALTNGAPGTLFAKLWAVIVLYPAIGVVFWIGTVHFERARRKAQGARPAMNADDARNVVRVAHAGFIFLICVGLIMIATQVGLALGYFGVLQPPIPSGIWIVRTGAVASGILMMYFGNAWSRTPMPRAPEYRAVPMMKFKRRVAWLIVTYGLLLALGALFLMPQPGMGIVMMALTITLILCILASIFMLNTALKSRPAS